MNASISFPNPSIDPHFRFRLTLVVSVLVEPVDAGRAPDPRRGHHHGHHLTGSGTDHVGEDLHQMLQVVQMDAVLEKGTEVWNRLHSDHPFEGTKGRRGF